MKKFLLALAAVLVLCVPAFAYDSNSFVSTVNASLSNNSTLYCDAPSGNAVFFAIVTGADQVTIYGISQTSGATVRAIYNNNDVQNKYCNRSVTGTSGSAYVADKVAYPTLSSVSDSMSVYPLNTAMTTVVDDYLGWLINPNPNPTPGAPVTVHVPYGNVLYIKVDQRQEDIQLVAHMPKLSFLIPDRNYGYWGETGICWGDYNTLPYSGLTFPLNGMSGIDWQRDSSRNILGQTKTGVATKIMNPGVWYALFCPSLFGHFDLDSSSALPGASVDVTGVFSDIRLYPLSDSYSFVDNEVINGSDSEFMDYFDGEPTDSGTVTWTDQDGNVSAPRAGGSSYVPEAETAESLVSQIKNILGNIVKELQSLFTFGYDAIQTLVILMSDFVSGFSQLYTWLPAPVYSALIAAITVAIVIGVFKVFL